MVQLETRKPS